ncbi:glycerophosphodiester phosphodiesterase [Streptomyces ovatisporus]|uniref:Glycerophosphodiester phosphodiesterase n=1 Tax=Streptomyces ovatisporus TaxID=1128682 RepID=A0ABV8ZZ71_9ACTN
MVAVTLTSARALVLRLLFPLVVLASAALTPGCAPARIRADDGPRVGGLPGTVYAAHRGGALEVPENSMSGLLATYRERTTDVLDVDVRSLRGGTPVAMHDRTLDRTTDHRGPVGELSLRDWRRVRTRPSPGLPGSWSPERPPTAAAVLDRFGGRTVLNIEIKDVEGLEPLARMVRERGLTESVYVQSNSVRLAARAHRMGLLTSAWRSVKQARADRPSRWRRFIDMLSVDHRARSSDIRRAARSGIPRVWAHTILTPAERDRVLKLGCDGVMTDAPRLLARTDGRERPRTANRQAQQGR